MKKLVLSVFLLGLLAPGAAHAEPKFLGLWWWSGHWKNQDFKPYYQDGQMPHDTQWSKEDWEPADWVYLEGGDGVSLIQRFYNTRIIKDQYMDDGVPYLEVGPNFYHLSGQDKGRVLATVDHVYQVSQKSPSTIYLKDGITDDVIGFYTPAAGLILE